MNNKLVISNVLNAILDSINNLSDDELDKISLGNFQIELKFGKEKQKKNEEKQSPNLDQNTFDLVIEKLNEATSREEGIMILESHISLKPQLESFAKKIDVAVMKSDKVDKIKNSIVDATVGARLRSNAIQGKEI
jgi:hypothetical protein